MNSIHISNATYVVMLFSFISGYFNYIFILLFLITIHEMGHLFFCYLVGYKKSEVIIYPFGGVTKYNELLNSSMLKEFLILLGGPLFQGVLFLLLTSLYKNGFINENNYLIINNLHKTLLYFNFLPIIPLDGSKVLNLLLEKVLPYKKANILLIIISFITIFTLAIYQKQLVILLLASILIKTIIIEIKLHKIKYNKFLLERYLYSFNFKKGKTIKNIKNIKRSKTHFIIENKKIYSEKEYLNKFFKGN